METWKKIVIGTVATGALVGGTIYVVRLNKMSAELETVPRAKIHKIDLTGLTIRVDVQLKNPSRTPFKIKFPFIKLVYKGTTVGSSQVVDKDISIPAFGEAVIDQILIKIPMINIFSLSGGLIQAVQSGQATKVDITTLTTIDLGWKKMPYSKSDTVILSKAK
ncbi:MAG: hypothetical protein ACT4ON_13275 [Bacteroidota bacterium]